VAPSVKRYIVELVRTTRESADVYLGSSPRGSLGLFKAGQAWAAINGRDYVLPDDIKAIAEHVLAHRIMINPSARLRDITSIQIVQETLKAVAVPGGDMSQRVSLK
jgi:MoxR-like ATPase